MGTRGYLNHLLYRRRKSGGEYPISRTDPCVEARITSAIVDAAAKVRDLNFKYLAEGKGATVTARFGKDGITLL